MNDTELRRDARRFAAMQTDQGSHHGWDFRPCDEPPVWAMAMAEVLRPRSIILLAVMAGVLSLFWL